MNNEFTYRLANWELIMFLVDAAAVAALAVWGVLTVKKIKKEKSEQ